MSSWAGCRRACCARSARTRRRRCSRSTSESAETHVNPSTYLTGVFMLVAAASAALVLSSGLVTPFRQMALLIVIAVLLPLQMGTGPTNGAIGAAVFLCGTAVLRHVLTSKAGGLERSRV